MNHSRAKPPQPVDLNATSWWNASQYVPSQPGYQPDELNEKICHGKLLEWNIKGEFGWIRPHGCDESGSRDVFCSSKEVVGGDLLIRGYDVEYMLTEGHRTISRNFVPDAGTAVPDAYGPIAKYAKARQVGRWRDRNGATAKGYYFQMDPRY